MAKGVKTGGRTRGTPNKRRIETRQQLQDYLDTRGMNVFEVLTTLMQTSADERIRIQAAIALLDRLMPRLKNLELAGDPERPLTVTDATARQARIAALLAQRNGDSGTEQGEGPS